MEDFLRVMQALNDKSRLEILMFLKAGEDMLCVCDLQITLPPLVRVSCKISQ
ncbi:hypothetical protein ACH7GM_000175 [Campylobacter upsaliensis]|uniref:hypothetical protein n=1 Tax=Campylobacter upsaliensis TaxID=28080 RepID=UPI0019975F35|nr:hypothetical protein [Campylobacter upsaliensis]EFU2059219.1 hypothetical protein [Campylobacter upsaliensis]EHZ0304411.1 hypothetical protein [Campylobacter upsaliensis]EIJ6626462.1 hypothetical protein [Campylobacter upsaliensis]EIL6893743.1 hypothetical protein [Campylobacter upsaliensis]EIZ9323994.1 hypothetical protein [Campylobacter upsaliensis]